MSEIIVYATQTCPYCTMARQLLESKSLEYNVIDVGRDHTLWQAMAEKSGRTTVPQIFIGAHHVGGFDDLSAANQSGELDQILAKA